MTPVALCDVEFIKFEGEIVEFTQKEKHEQCKNLLESEVRKARERNS